MTPEQIYKERGDCSTDLQWSVCSADNKETENVILINRQRQVRMRIREVLKMMIRVNKNVSAKNEQAHISDSSCKTT